jgi:hypothetical protein
MRSEDIIKIAQIYARHKNLKLPTVSTYVFGSGDMIRRLQAGRDITIGRATRAMQWFSDNWPDDATWPDDVPRPPVTNTNRGAA